MAHSYGTIEVKKMRGKMTICGLGLTPRGQKYLKLAIPTTATSARSTDFQGIQKAAIKELFLEEPSGAS